MADFAQDAAPRLGRGTEEDTTGCRRRVALAEVVGPILYQLKTGGQWRWLPGTAVFNGELLSWQGVYCHFHAWGKQAAWKCLRLTLLRLHRRLLGRSSGQLDGRHTPAKNGGATVGHQGRRAARAPSGSRANR